MLCPLCGEICECALQANSSASPRSKTETDAYSAAASQESRDAACKVNPNLEVEADFPGSEDESAPENSSTWRQEVAERLNRYQSRRKPRPPRYPSLRLRFPTDEATRISAESSTLPPVLTSSHALALDRFDSAVPVPDAGREEGAHSTNEVAASFYSTELPSHTAPALAAQVTAKIIEFPRSWTPPPPKLDELADPVFDQPRILEVPEVAPPPPALGGITIEPVKQPAVEKRPGIDIPLQAATLERRVLSAIIDNLIIASACALFGFIFWKLTATRPLTLQIIRVLAGLYFALWAAYNYLLVVYAGTTPGLRLAGLTLLRFDDRQPPRGLRRWRVLASFLSAVSLCMGYIWVFLDEDSLCWHDRITQTYLAPKKRKATSGK
jgi:RDD family